MSLARAQRDLQKTQSDTARLELQLDELKQKSIKISHFIEMLSVYKSDEVSREAPTSRSASSGTTKTVQAVEEILRESKQPMKTRELLAKLSSRGINIGGQIPANNLSGTLSKASIFSADRTKGWSLKSSSDESLDLQSFTNETVAGTYVSDIHARENHETSGDTET